jgi:hypothetical protein
MTTDGAAGLDTTPSLKPMDVAARVGCALITANLLLRSGKIRCINVGTAGRDHYRTSEAWLAEFLAGKGGRQQGGTS